MPYAITYKSHVLLSLTHTQTLTRVCIPYSIVATAATVVVVSYTSGTESPIIATQHKRERKKCELLLWMNEKIDFVQMNN